MRPRGTTDSTILRMTSSVTTVMWLSKKPGAMALTVMWSAASFLAKDLVSVISPPLEAAYAIELPDPAIPATEATLTTAPRPRRTMPGSVSVREATFKLLRELGLTCIFGNPGSTEETFLKNFPKDFDYVMALQEASVVGIACGPAIVDSHVAALGPARLLQAL